jgi:amino-acid N-acetyltransferase
LLTEEKFFVDCFRNASPYIHAHRGRTIVISIGGEAVKAADFAYFIHDIALLSSLGIRLVLVHGIRPQIEQALRLRGQESSYVNGRRITDDIALQCVKVACGEVRTEIESLLSMGLSHSPTTPVRIQTVSGNFITARPLGVRDGVDYCYTGEVRRVDAQAITRRLDEGCIVLISPIGYSLTGETFNLLTEEVAMEVAMALQAAKWLCFIENEGVLNTLGKLMPQLTVIQAQEQLDKQQAFPCKRQVIHAIKACQNGVERVHLLSWHIEGALFLELFTREGIGTLISTDPYEHLRSATIDDVVGLLELIEPLEEAGILVRRSREKLEMEINYFTVQERDGMIIACAALYPFLEEGMAELACLAVHTHYRGDNRGDALLSFLERQALEQGITQIFVLTTRTAHWFAERGFVAANLESLPVSRQALYNYQRNAKVFIKRLYN